MIKLYIPIRIVSEANIMEHWSKKHRRHKAYKEAITLAWKTSVVTPPTPPLNITLTRIAPRMLDDDNNQAALKKVRDIIADLIIPGLQPGRADDPCHGLQFNYLQKKGNPKEYALMVQISGDLCVGEERVSRLSRY